VNLIPAADAIRRLVTAENAMAVTEIILQVKYVFATTADTLGDIVMVVTTEDIMDIGAAAIVIVTGDL
jgi:hypothetical protein